MASGKHKFARNAAPTINDDLRLRIAEDLLLGADRDLVIQRLASMGISGQLAQSEVERAEKSPYFKAAGRLSARLKKRDWLLANQAKLAMGVTEVPRRHKLAAADFFRDFYHAHRPVLLSGLIDHWPAREKWSLDHLHAQHGFALIRAQWERERDPDYEVNSTAHGETRPFAEFLARLRTPNNDVYMTANNHDHNRQALAALWEDVGGIPGYLSDEPGRDGFLWIGPKGTITPWHHDLTNNLLLQISGTKRVLLAASHDIALMRNSRHCFSDWGGEALPPGPATGQRPAILSVDIAPGDILFIPVGWWHHVEALDVTIGMSFTNFAADNDFYSHYDSYGAH
ncbi:cupin-like domain-containing protein [Sphingobium boeckii]|uniref:JmjC domain-containing protein n=1 Tax=Sphingobium boeckii TaxID=1082345 RepID=A0A7W9AEM4_9SPHN|nr:cupin-like domain-containing protein [Sphingobium boeckii]MBB5684039.1 hypothetical protein [Sphingobium boeckii]